MAGCFINSISKTTRALLILCSLATAQTFTDMSTLLSPAAPPGNNTGQRGCSAADFNNDGLIDLYHANFTSPGRLYLNQGEDGFVDVLSDIDLDEGQNMWGAAFGDYNNDGYPDIIFQDLSDDSKLYRNNRNGTFTQTNAEANVDVLVLAQGAAWGDFNRDGLLDFIIVNDVGPNQLFKNLDYTVFDDISVEANVQTVGNSYGVSWGDINNDGYPDAYISTCHGSDPLRSINHLLLNNGDETFTNIGHDAAVADSLPGWGVVFLDYDNDQDLDIFCANSYHPPRVAYNRLYRNEGDNTFFNASQIAGVRGGSTENSYGVAAGDFDNDGWEDLYINDTGQPDRLYRNNGNGTFTDIAASAGIVENEHRTVAVADLNNDGWLDIFTAGSPENTILFNDGGSNHWLRISARGISDNYFGVGARIEIHSGNLVQIREIRAGDSFCSQSNSLTAHFGLGSATVIDSLSITWPGGSVDSYVDYAQIDQHVTLVQGGGIDLRPSTFELLAPIDLVTLSGDADLHRFEWTAATDPDDDALVYQLYIHGEAIGGSAVFDTIVSAINGQSIDISGESLPDNYLYRWSAEVTDDTLITASKRAGEFIISQGTSIENDKEGLPDAFVLEQNYPNPFNPETQFGFRISDFGFVEINIFDVRGTMVKTIINEQMAPGRYTVTWDGTNDAGTPVGSGVYFYRLAVHSALRTPHSAMEMTRKMLLIR